MLNRKKMAALHAAITNPVATTAPVPVATLTLTDGHGNDHDFIQLVCVNPWHNDMGELVWHTFHDASDTLDGGDISWGTIEELLDTMVDFGVLPSC